VLFSDTGEVETTSVLELDPQGATDLTAMNSSPHDGFGVRLGEFVFIHREGTSNGYETPRVPRIGELETWVQEISTDADGQVCGWRKELSQLGTRLSTAPSPDAPPEGLIKQVPLGSGQGHWVGEVTRVSSHFHRHRPIP
jgi:ubiquitin-conjugating enzyme E2 O